jgi:hypothetical protein
MGESLDRPCNGRTRCGDQVDDQSSSKFGPIPASLVLCPCACFHHFVPRLCVARERADCQHCVHGTTLSPYLSLNVERIRLGYRPLQHGQASSQYHPDMDRPDVTGEQPSFLCPLSHSTSFFSALLDESSS